MSDDQQGWSEAPPVRRKGPPKWMILTGCGCLLPGFFLVALMAWAMQFYGSATSPRAAYDSLARTLPYDETLMGRSTGLADDPATRVLESHEAPEFELLFGADIPFSGGVAIHYLARGARVEDDRTEFAEDALVAMITKVPASQSEGVLRGQTSADEGEPFQLEVQGVTLSGMRHATMTSDILTQFPRGTIEVTGPGVALKVRTGVAQDPDDEDSKIFDVLLTLQRPRSDAAPVSDEDIRTFLAPFHVGPAR